MNFSTNQAIQFYCVPTGSAPSIQKLGASGKETHAFLEFTNGAGETVRTDLIQLGHITDVKNVAASSDTKALKGVGVTLNSSVNSGNPVVGQEYIIRVTIKGTIGEECTYTKQASYVAKTGDTAGTVLAGLAGNLLVNLTEDYPLYEIYDTTVSASTKITAKVSNGAITLTKNGSTVTSVTKLVIAEPKPFWKLGTFPEQTMNFDVTVAPIIVSTVEVPDWATFSSVSAGTIPNTHKVADLEYFALGEKGADDVHGFSIITDGNVALQVNPNDSNGYNVLTVQYYHTGARDAVQKSERTLVIVAPSTISLDSLATAFTNLM